MIERLHQPVPVQQPSNITLLSAPSHPLDPGPQGLTLTARTMVKDGFKMWSAAPLCIRPRIAAVGVTPPTHRELDVLRWIITAGDRRYWSWSAHKAPAGGKIRNSLMRELGLDKGNLSRALKALTEAGLVQILHKASGQETIVITEYGKGAFAEVAWRHKLLDALPQADCEWGATSHGVSESLIEHHLDYARAADIRAAARFFTSEASS